MYTLALVQAIKHGKESVPMPRMWDARSGSNAGAGRERQSGGVGDLRKREGIETRDDLAQEPSPTASLGFGNSRPFAIAAMLLGIVSPLEVE